MSFEVPDIPFSCDDGAEDEEDVRAYSEGVAFVEDILSGLAEGAIQKGYFISFDEIEGGIPDPLSSEVKDRLARHFRGRFHVNRIRAGLTFRKS